MIGISASSRADLLAELDRLGTNLLQVSAGPVARSARTSELPTTAPAMIRRIGPVRVGGGDPQRAARPCAAPTSIDDAVTGGIAVVATEPELLATLGGDDGRRARSSTTPWRSTRPWCSARRRRPGSASTTSTVGPLVWLGEQWFTVVGILDPVPLAPDIDRAALIGYPIARSSSASTTRASTVRVRTDPDRVEAVRDVLGADRQPGGARRGRRSPGRPTPSRRKAQADDALTALLLGLGGVALLVGGIGIANVLVISVLERRTEIGIRRALGATRRHIRLQFLVEAVLLAAGRRRGRRAARLGGDRRLRRVAGLDRRRAAGRARPAASASPSPSAPSPASTRPPEPPAWRPPTPSGRSERATTVRGCAEVHDALHARSRRQRAAARGSRATAARSPPRSRRWA